MKKIILASDGIFPLADKETTAKTGFSVSGTIQGEGKLAGTPSIFIRLAGCNLRCIWKMNDGNFSQCDTPYASFHPTEVTEQSVDEILDTLKAHTSTIKHIVITGGEPLLQIDGLIELCKRIKQELNLHISIESNGTLFSKELTSYVDLFSISPKLKNSEPSKEKYTVFKVDEKKQQFYDAQKRRNLHALQQYVDLKTEKNYTLQLKFVASSYDDETEIKSDYVNKLNNLSQTDVMLMPLGRTDDELALSEKNVLEIALRNGWWYSQRLHIRFFGNKAGV